jgi:hypothetical protein
MRATKTGLKETENTKIPNNTEKSSDGLNRSADFSVETTGDFNKHRRV